VLGNVQLTSGQLKALELVRKLLKSKGANGEPLVGIWRGYAGVGKTFCLRALIEEHGKPILLAPTGKAALRLSELTGETASTLHRWLYATQEDPTTGELVFDMKPLSELKLPENRLLVVDEASMIGRDLWDDLLAAASYTGCNILLVGDHFQLPPVEPNETTPFSVLADGFPCWARQDMTEIVRQALDNPIVRSSLALRKGEVDAVEENLRTISGQNEVWDFVKDFYAAPGNGSVLCYTNKMRHLLNRNARTRLGITGPLQAKEPLLILKNLYDVGVYNGEVVEFAGFKDQGATVDVENTFPPHQSAKAAFGVTKMNGVKAVLSPEGVDGQLHGFSRKSLSEAARKSLGFKMPPPPQIRGRNGRMLRGFTPIIEANFGYTLTVHKSQGSEWKNVLVVIENGVPLGNEEGRRWLYTAITRARNEAALFWT
jgi:exodeoxyribonuclease V